MSVPYDTFIEVFLEKITEYKYLDPALGSSAKTRCCDGYLKRSCAQFNRKCSYDLTYRDDEKRVFNFSISNQDLDEIVDIISEGMVAQWFKPYANNSENLENVINTSDFSNYSPAELLHRIREAYNESCSEFKKRMINYTYEHGDLTDLHI